MATFAKNNQPFVCRFCGASVVSHPTSSRDHCNKCLKSLHVDVTPGDRRNKCKGVLEPVGIDIKGGEQRIVYRCQSCGQQIFCVVAPDDDREEILRLVTKIWKV